MDGMVVPKPAGGRDVAPIGASSQVSHAQLVGLHTTARTSSVVPRVAVIMLVHADYAQRYLANCYTSLSAQTYPRTQWQLFIVTNGVDAATRSWIKQA
ncbi:MAG: hypothetical protein HYT88_02435, partial [Candidatus Omnitrophica bacterium]|nr:hypothetical protein [Candidatus Omnitrophota bacterium]